MIMQGHLDTAARFDADPPIARFSNMATDNSGMAPINSGE
jgi:hypothetical protein